ncbi:MAG: 50S ribosomal protein L11 [Candidatus Pacebacteria bacterium RIFOXYB1_FULL_39_46]|nr:MAG: 50S ribosomal protein L11 [Candidatus Pacebacteria bacterium RIFOXYA1_FULL_38_18]OGJ38421.1 MAG: 50S ribosomal protein L11 [Candidatus Pacebacteria bacterium RIFOXYB1_FULL_39_46]OGJ40282.1 MAG: 50S ribosomal protein L11 [Candidatus Pacebacteria bacterium RIFOXYC1_FULL_39_21]OGJ40854.1 MAG: 50S ribosomal protein L11 [Candidatus Pacebacteria bacterium RIFOXYD1_FULL_39_27]
MAKKVEKIIKLNLPAGSATPAPPIGPILGGAGINMMEFLKQYNDATKDQRGQIIPAELTIYKDKSFDFVLKLPPVSDLIKQELKLKKGSSTPKTEVVGTLTNKQIKQIAEKKMPDLNTNNLDQAIKTIKGTARSMGVKIQE